MISGNETKTYFQTGHPLELGKPPGSRFDTIHVDFPAGRFNTTPDVQVMLNLIDAEKNANLRVGVSAVNITTNGFDIKIETWYDTKLYKVGVTWFAHKGQG